MCMSCGHVGCCDNSPHRHASAHFGSQHYPIVQSYESGEDWRYCADADCASALSRAFDERTGRGATSLCVDLAAIESHILA